MACNHPVDRALIIGDTAQCMDCGARVPWVSPQRTPRRRVWLQWLPFAAILGAVPCLDLVVEWAGPVVLALLCIEAWAWIPHVWRHSGRPVLATWLQVLMAPLVRLAAFAVMVTINAATFGVCSN